MEQELSEGDRRAVSTHLARCEHCSRDLFAMQKAVNLLRWLPKADARPGFEDRLSEQLHAPAEQPSTWAWLERWRGFGESLAAGARGLLGETLIATPASALLVAILVGTGGGALVMREVMKSSGRAPGGLAASTPEIMSAPGVATNAIPAELAAAAAGAPVVPVVNPPAATPTPEASQLAA
ncbi:MAG TPA: hypothetical protein VNM87_07890, partial [Candidatus Udaeobacter sp.]|nr:hypothetical protein [Candidatus Udaeobacter sp.]